MPDLFFWIGWILTAWLMADLVTGLIHWWEDRYAQPHWPILGDLVAKPQELHHTDPSAFLAGRYLFRNSTSLIPAAAFAMIFAGLGWWWWVLVTAFASQANEIHCWAHRGQRGRLIQVLQGTGILQDPRSHGWHHKHPFDRSYCVMSNWLNPVLDALHFWRGLEWLVRMITKVKVKAA